MKVLHVIKKQYPIVGGDATYIRGIMKHLKKKGVETKAISVTNPKVFEGGAFGKVLSYVNLLKEAKRVAKTMKPDVINIHSLDLAVFGEWIGLHKLTKKYVVTVHGIHGSTPLKENFFKKKVKIWFERKIAGSSNVDGIIAIDPYAEEVMKKHKNVKYIPNWINLKEWRKNLDKAKEIKLKHPAILGVGRLTKVKNFKALVKIMEYVPHCTLYLIGDGEQREMLESIAGSNVVFLGELKHEELIKYYKSADGLVISSIWEGLPSVLLEAWASELFIVFPPLPSLKKIEKDISKYDISKVGDKVISFYRRIK